jgi:uncharacterized protein YbjT (DUF2867 family)
VTGWPVDLAPSRPEGRDNPVADSERILVTGAGGGVGGVGRTVVEMLRARGLPVRAMVHREDERADALRAFGAEVVAGDLTNPAAVAAALDGCPAVFFSMSVSPAHLEAAATVATVACAVGGVEALVGMSQMTVSQMTAQSTEESHQQRLHWLSERVLDWSGLPVVHIRPTIFLDNPLFTTLAARSIADSGTIQLPFGTGRTSPIAAVDVARVVATVLADPRPHLGRVLELTGPTSQDMTGIAEEFTRALGRPVSYVDVPLDAWAERVAATANLPPHVEEHLITMARLHRSNRYDRSTDTVERVTGTPARSIEQFVAERSALFGR